MKLPIDVVFGNGPPQFKWTQVIGGPSGERSVVDHEGTLQPSVEQAIVDLVALAKQLLKENATLRGQIQGMESHIQQGENAGEAAELAARGVKKTTQAAPGSPSRKGRG